MDGLSEVDEDVGGLLEAMRFLWEIFSPKWVSRDPNMRIYYALQTFEHSRCHHM